MINFLIEISAKNKYLVVLLTAAAVFGSWQCLKRMPLDAVPDLSDTQVIIYSRWDQTPDVIEDQVTYPIISALLGAPKIKAIRGVTDFGYSYVYVIFEDGTDLYWARSRVMEYLSKIQAELPAGVKTEMGPDATSVGWVYQYAVTDPTTHEDLFQLRGLQDWTLRFAIQSVPGVAEVASVGGYVKQYQVTIDPIRLQAYHVTLTDVIDSLRQNNSDAGGRLLDFSGTEFMVRSQARIHSKADIEATAIHTRLRNSPPLLIRDVAHVNAASELRRGVTDLNGEGDTVGGIVVMRQGENALQVIDRVKQRLKELQPSLPAGVQIVPTYDRSTLIRHSISTLDRSLLEEMLIVSAVILFFLWHVPSAIVPILTIPVAVLLSFVPLYFMGITVNLMSLAGLAISIGVLVDGAIIQVENTYKRTEEWMANGRPGDGYRMRLDAMKEVGPSVFLSLLVIAVAFFPIFTLVDQEGKLFKPLALSKTLVMAVAALLAVTFDPALRMLFTRLTCKEGRARWWSWIINTTTVGHYRSERNHPVSRTLVRCYEPVCRWVLNHRLFTVGAAVVLFLTVIPLYWFLGSEFMPPLNEEAFLYMPTTLPGISASEVQRVLQTQDQILRRFPEVENVFGKAGRAETSTDPAPLSMVETTVVLKPRSQWPAHETIDQLEDRMDQALKFPGMPNIWTMPIKNRIDMLATGIRTPVGIKILGPDLNTIQQIGEQLEGILKQVPGTRSVLAERTAGGYYVDFILKRQNLARYGLTVDDAQTMIRSAIGGETVSTDVEGRERYGISVRYAPKFRQDLPALRRVSMTTPSGAQIPLEAVADIQRTEGPSMIRDENGQLAGYVFIDVGHRDLGGYIAEAKRVVEEKLPATPGYSLQWSGQYENMIRVKERLKMIVPLTLFVIGLLLYLNTRSAVKTGIVMLAVPGSLIGAIGLLFILGYHTSVATWVGMIALMGLDAETGIFMVLFLDLAYNARLRAEQMNTEVDLKKSILQGAAQRLRPKLMTVTAAFAGLLPLMISAGTGADLMKRVAAPMVGGLVTSFALELLIYPVIYYWWKKYEMKIS